MSMSQHTHRINAVYPFNHVNINAIAHGRLNNHEGYYQGEKGGRV